jgi:hypothetical protein
MEQMELVYDLKSYKRMLEQLTNGNQSEDDSKFYSSLDEKGMTNPRMEDNRL